MRLITISPVAESLLDAQLIKLIFLQNLNKKILSSTLTCACARVRAHARAHAHTHTYIIGWVTYDPVSVFEELPQVWQQILAGTSRVYILQSHLQWR